MDIERLKVNAHKAATLLKAIGNEKRLLILCHLVDGERSVGELEKLVDLSQSALSQHLARLRKDGLVKTRRSAQTIYYSLDGEDAVVIMHTLHDICCGSKAAGKAAARTPEPAVG